MGSVLLASSDDLSAKARIRECALALFAERGVAATSVRAVGEAAGVSPALVVHHYGSKQGLRSAVDVAVVDALEQAASDITAMPERERVGLLTERLAVSLRDRPVLGDYIGRTLAEGGDAGLELLELMLESARRGVGRAAKRGELRDEVEVGVAALQVVILLLGPYMIRPLIERLTSSSMLEEDALERWMAAAADLLREGIYR